MSGSLAARLPQIPDRLRALLPGTDIGLAFGVVVLLSVLVLPLPPFVLDTGLSLSLTSAVSSSDHVTASMKSASRSPEGSSRTSAMNSSTSRPRSATISPGLRIRMRRGLSR